MLQCRMLVRHCCLFWQQCRSNVRLRCHKGQQCRTSFALKFCPFDKVERCYDIVASVDRALLVWLPTLCVGGPVKRSSRTINVQTVTDGIIQRFTSGRVIDIADFRFSRPSDMIGAPESHKFSNGSHDLTTHLSGTVCRP